MSDRLVLGGFSNMYLVDLRYHIDIEDFSNSFIELFASDQRGIRHLRFSEPSNLEIEKGFSGSLSGMEIIDISDRQWSGIRIEVRNFEQDPGITFLAKSMEILIDTNAA